MQTKIVFTIPVVGKPSIETPVQMDYLPLPGEKIAMDGELYIVYERIYIITKEIIIYSIILKFAL